ncbi:MAG: SOS response-associated peptidase [Gemmatimonadaceae bacterium]|jgi:putative SOS response-associated peptidase YedK
MCGRFALSKSDRIDWAQFGVKRGPMLPPHWNLGPGRAIAAVRDAGEGPEVAMLRWGLIPFWASDPAIGARLANARAESAAEKPAFRAAFRARRCLIPADGFYEWQVVAGASNKQPWFVQRADGGVFALAGLWERWMPKAGVEGPDGEGAIETCTILTTEPNAMMAPIHSRMPVIVSPAAYAAWLSADTSLADAHELLAAWDPSAWLAHRVGLRVNATANDDAACVAPIPDN